MLEIVILIFVLIIVVIYYQGKMREINARIESLAAERARHMFSEWREVELMKAREELEEALSAKYDAKLKEELQRKEEEIREDAIRRSLATILGRVGEELAPIFIFHKLGIEPKDMRHLGTPVDYVVFKGYSQGNVEEIIFVEIKTGETTALTSHERSVQRAIEEGRVRFEVMNIRQMKEMLSSSP